MLLGLTRSILWTSKFFPTSLMHVQGKRKLVTPMILLNWTAKWGIRGSLSAFSRPNTKVVAITRNGCRPLLAALPTWRTYHHNTPYSQRCVSFRYLRLCLTVESYPKVCVYAAATFLYAARVYSVVVLSSAPNISEFHVVRQYWYLLLSVTRSRRMPVPWVGVSQPGSVDLRPSRV